MEEEEEREGVLGGKWRRGGEIKERDMELYFMRDFLGFLKFLLMRYFFSLDGRKESNQILNIVS